jgi:hypothetical protein
MSDGPPPRNPQSRSRPRDLILIAAVALLLPLGLRPIAARVSAGAPLSYLPALETFRERVPYDPTFREDIRRIRPEFVFIGDSMLGSRIDPAHMRRAINRQTWWVMQPGTGSAWWYLAFKNHVLDAGVTPKAAIVFFRDYNLTDVMFRLDASFRWSLDTVAGPEEPELNAVLARRRQGGWSAVHAAVERVYDVAPLKARADDRLSQWPAEHLAGSRRAAAFTKDMNGLFAFEKLRPMADADMAAEQAQADLAENLPTSILPELIRLARSRGVRLVFVRVQRRPRPDGPPLQSPALRKYVADLRAYLESEGAIFIDDTGNPAFTLDWYKDGDHMLGSKRRAYTDAFAKTAAPLFE